MFKSHIATMHETSSYSVNCVFLLLIKAENVKGLISSIQLLFIVNRGDLKENIV